MPVNFSFAAGKCWTVGIKHHSNSNVFLKARVHAYINSLGFKLDSPNLILISESLKRVEQRGRKIFSFFETTLCN